MNGNIEHNYIILIAYVTNSLQFFLLIKKKIDMYMVQNSVLYMDFLKWEQFQLFRNAYSCIDGLNFVILYLIA